MYGNLTAFRLRSFSHFITVKRSRFYTWSSLYCFGHNSRQSFDFFFVTLLGWDLEDAEFPDVASCESLEFPLSMLSAFSCSNELLSATLICFSLDCVEDFELRLSLFLTALPIAPLFLKLLKRGFLSCTGEIWSSWALWQLSSHTVNSISPRSIALAGGKKGKKGSSDKRNF